MRTTDLKRIVHSDPKIMGGRPVFVGTRVPVESLFDHLKAGDSIEAFLDGFPSVKREQVLAVLELVEHEILAHAWCFGVLALLPNLKPGQATVVE